MSVAYVAEKNFVTGMNTVGIQLVLNHFLERQNFPILMCQRKLESDCFGYYGQRFYRSRGTKKLSLHLQKRRILG